MTEDPQKLYEKRLKRYTDAMRNEKPDKVPIRPFVAEFTAKYAGFTCQEVTHDYDLAYKAVQKCARDFDWDAVVSNMVYVWTGLTQAIGLDYYGIPGIHTSEDHGFQYREPPKEEAFMKPEEYDDLIEDPTGYLFNVWFPRVSSEVSAPDENTSYRNNLSFLKGGTAMQRYFNSFGEQNRVLKEEIGTVPAISGIFKSPFDIIADKLRGYYGLAEDVIKRPGKVLAAAKALMPHIYYMALSGADPEGNVPIPIWMHRGCSPLFSPEHFEKFNWTTLKPIIEELWANGHQVLIYAEGDWSAHLESFAELPEGSIVYHVDKGDIFRVNEVIGDKFCISGGLPNHLLTYGSEKKVRDKCRELIDRVGRDGGYIMDTSAIIQNDARIENIRAMTECTREHGIY
ncbi:MAG: uroporphyrinogen decarboxylase family protein [Candidatus Acetothermia bacterium]